MADHTGNVWMGTYSGGINIFYSGNSNFSNIGEQIGKNIGLKKPLAEAIIGDADGGLWIGTFGGGINYINRKKGTTAFYDISDEIKALVKDSLGNIWTGTLDVSISHLLNIKKARSYWKTGKRIPAATDRAAGVKKAFKLQRISLITGILRQYATT